VRNIGAKATAFDLVAQSPFGVMPSSGHLASGECLQVSSSRRHVMYSLDC
jgi:hypothetical protein